MKTKKCISLPNGQQMPILGFGTWQASEEEIETALDLAFEAGYRHIDTATVYENENAIGKVIKKWLDSGKIKRSELFIVTKLPPVGVRPEGVEKWIKKSIANLQLDYLDLYLVHVPFTFQEIGENLHPKNEKGEIMIDTSTDHVKIWKEMEKQVELGRTKSIGLSNFNETQINKILSIASIPISNLQVELHVYFQQVELVEFCKSNNISMTAYSPLGNRGLVKLLGKTDVLPDLLTNAVVLKIAQKYNKTAAQILLKHILCKGISTIPKSTNPQRIKENIQLFDWELEDEDILELEALNKGKSARICDFSFMKGIKNHPEYPF
ncbi:PREDICTED: alcohol dehydrogenase [NADP(+)] [Polistes dominula]|uniref:Alcohol dehydrogenase [NADP(+)] n=1 Tax=Polistes dominula TaxID=743375 RepID=A0ABM1JGM8_POLDO|nr:PREDICTED: alcohol dehydrogenase [NADP(+)] [Polistes dominula]XP_015191623.1 PREDICTED: alcohol dehydrogenase [NADP(+)] [Polistes dominula]